MRLELSDAASIYYELHGPKPGTAPAIVFAHGAGGNHLSWWQQVPHFRDRFTCLVFDHRGWGWSTKPADGAKFADDLRALFDHVSIEKATIVAQSMGGWTALRFAIDSSQRVDRIVLCDTHGGISHPDVDGWGQASAENAKNLPPGMHVANGERIYREQPTLAFLYEEIDALNFNRREDAYATIRQAGTVSPEEAASLNVPVLFLYGDEDIVIPPPYLEAAARIVPNARVEKIARTGHSAYFERAAEFNAAVEAFLAE